MIRKIKYVLNGGDLEQILELRKQELETEISLSTSQLLQINNLLEGKSMEREVILKELNRNGDSKWNNKIWKAKSG